MGTPEFAVPCLDKIHQSNIEVAAVVTAPDRPAGRGRKLKASALKEYALEQNIPVLQPLKLRDDSFLEQLESYQADLFVVVAFRMLPEVVWKMPLKGTINLHASLLPQYRGAAPINWAIINGEQQTGVTTFFINEKIDEGSIIYNRTVAIDKKDKAGDLHDTLMNTGSELLLETVQAIFKGEAPSQQQNFNATLKAAPKLNKENTRINFNKPAEEINNLIRGLSPYPAAYTYLNQNDISVLVKIYDAEIIEENVENKIGKAHTDNKSTLLIRCEDYSLKVLELQIQGKKRMKINELLNGFKINPDSFFS